MIIIIGTLHNVTHIFLGGSSDCYILYTHNIDVCSRSIFSTGLDFDSLFYNTYSTTTATVPKLKVRVRAYKHTHVLSYLHIILYIIQ